MASLPRREKPQPPVTRSKPIIRVMHAVLWGKQSMLITPVQLATMLTGLPGTIMILRAEPPTVKRRAVSSASASFPDFTLEYFPPRGSAFELPMYGSAGWIKEEVYRTGTAILVEVKTETAIDPYEEIVPCGPVCPWGLFCGPYEINGLVKESLLAVSGL